MAISINTQYSIKIIPAQNLIIPSKQIVHFNHDKLKELIIYMYDNMIKDGIGLAAPQIGVNLSCMVLNPLLDDNNLKDALVEFDGKKCYALFNVKIISKAGDFALPNGEGCLSVASKNKKNEFLGKVSRYKTIKIEYQDIAGKRYIGDFEVDNALKTITAIVIQHELDHLNGILFPHRMQHQGLTDKAAILLKNYMVMHDLLGSQKRIDAFMKYGIENINNDLHLISTNEIATLCKDRNLSDSLIKEIIQYIELFDSK